jgi:arsenate reductase
MIKIYHNPRCTKSRQGVAFLEEKGLDFEIVKYLEDSFTVETLSITIKELGIKPIDLIRKNEAIWKSDFKGKELSDAEIIQAMVDFPKLIERPIIVNNGKAVVARPTEKIEEVL